MRMGRKRKHRKDLPPRVYFRHGAYYFVSMSGEWIWLSRDYHVAIKQYANVVQAPGTGKLASIMDRYIKEIAVTKSPRTLANNEAEVEKLKAVFGSMEPMEVTPQDIYGYMDNRPPISANREVALLSSVFKYAIRWGYANDNPCRLVSRNKETPRKRAVSIDDYQAVYNIAAPIIQCAMDLAVITALRLGDLLKLDERNAKQQGLYCETGKTGKKLLFEWNEDLTAVVARCRSLRGKIRSMVLLSNTQGQRYTVSGFETLWQRTMNKAMDKKILQERFRFNDLRAMAADLSEQASELLGHDDPRTTSRIYRRAPRRVKPNFIGH